MLINQYSGRSFNDLNQYPVFPWIICDYKSETLDLSNKEIYRDLTKPIGALEAERLSYFQQRAKMLNDSEENSFLYGSHYSNSGIVMYYLLRIEPFT